MEHKLGTSWPPVWWTCKLDRSEKTTFISMTLIVKFVSWIFLTFKTCRDQSGKTQKHGRQCDHPQTGHQARTVMQLGLTTRLALADRFPQCKVPMQRQAHSCFNIQENQLNCTTQQTSHLMAMLPFGLCQMAILQQHCHQVTCLLVGTYHVKLFLLQPFAPFHSDRKHNLDIHSRRWDNDALFWHPAAIIDLGNCRLSPLWVVFVFRFCCTNMEYDAEQSPNSNHN